MTLKRLQPWVLAASLWLAACGPVTVRGRGAPRTYEQAADSATSICVRTPACYSPAPGEQAILPWLVRSAEAVRTTAAVLKLLDEAQVARVKAILVDCAKEANFEVNERMLGEGRRPTREYCQEVVGRDSKGNAVTRAMELGKEKHRVALECARERLEKEVPGHYSLEPYYLYDMRTGLTRWLDPRQVEAWLRDGLYHLLRGVLRPDVVLHAPGDPLKVQAVYDFKFPCPADNPPRWNDYPEGHPYYPRDQKQMYGQALGVEEPRLVTPAFGVH